MTELFDTFTIAQIPGGATLAFAFGKAEIMSGTPAGAPSVPVWVWILLVISGAIATVTDLQSMRIPNLLSLPLLVMGIGYATATCGVSGLSASLIGAAAAGGIFVLAYALLGGGAGDAKLMLAFGAWLGLDASVPVVVATTLVGCIVALSVVISRTGIRSIPGVVVVSILRTVGGLLLLRRAIFLGTMGVPTPSAAPSAEQPSAESAGSEGPETKPEGGRRRPKGWLPYAPSILGGLILAWIYIEVIAQKPPT